MNESRNFYNGGTFDGIKYANDYHMQFTLQIIEARNSFLAQKDAEH